MISKSVTIKKVLWIVTAIIATLLLGIIVMNRKQASQEASSSSAYLQINEDGTVVLPLNSIHWMIRDPVTRKNINTENVIIPVEDKVKVIMEIEQNMPEAREYLLMVLKNNEQNEFILDNERCSSYRFQLDKQGEISFNIEVETNQDIDRELMFVFFKNPDYANSVVNSDADLFAVLPFHQALSSRLLLYGDAAKKPEIHYSDEAIVTDYDSRVHEIYLARDLEALRILAVAESGEKVNAIISNRWDYDVDYALGSFLNWQQHAFPDGEMIKYIHVPSHTTKVYELTMPMVDKSTPYQVYLIPNVYMSEEDAVLKQEVLRLADSLRTVIAPVKNDE